MIRDLDLLQTADYQKKLAQCIHCGLCLQACPTYNVFGTEMDSPRGRIALMSAASRGELEPVEFHTAFTEHINLCLACRACETACPSGVQYGALVEGARIVVEQNRSPGLAERFLRWIGVRQLMPHPNRLKMMARFVWLYQVTGLQKLVRRMTWLPKTLQAMEAILPPIRPQYQDYRTPASAVGASRGKVLFFTGCIQEALLSPTNQATVRVLQRNGYEVVTPLQQTCCGAAHLHLGDAEAARELARRNMDAFLGGGRSPQAQEYEAILCNAGGCGAALKEYPHLLAADPVYAEKARQFASKTQDVTEFLAAHLHHPPTGRVPLKATYADSCHLRHGQKIVRQPRSLLHQIPGLKLVELSAPDRCCGSAGVYNIAQTETANAILDLKMADIAATGAELVITTNTGCHMQLIAGARRAGLDVQVMHVVDVLDWSYRAAEGDALDETLI